MADCRWKGKALARAEVQTLTLGGTWQAGDTITFAIPDTSSGKQFTLTIGATVTTTAIGTAIAEAWNAANGDDLATDYSATEYGANIPEFDEITAAAASSTTVTFTHDTKGTPFTLAVSRVTAVSGSVSLTTTTAATGPNHWDNAVNWSGSALPVTGVNEIQTLTITGTPTGGDFTITYSGQTTAAIAFDASAAAVQSALEALSNIAVGDVSCGGGALPGTPVTITFTGTLGYQNVALATTTDSLTGGTAPASAIATTTAGVTGDRVFFDNSDVPVKYALDQSAIVLSWLQIDQSYTDNAAIGLPEVNSDGDEYLEYRDQYLKIGVVSPTGIPVLVVGLGNGDGSGMLKINTGSLRTDALIVATGDPDDDNIGAFIWKGSHASNTLVIRGDSSVAVAPYGGDTATVATLTADGSAEVLLGLGASVATATLRGQSQARINGAITTSLTTLSQSQATIEGAGAVAQLYARDDSTVAYNSTGTLGGNTALSGNAVLTFDGDPRAKTVTNPIEIYSNAQVIDTNVVANGSGSLVLDFNETTPPGLQLGRNIRLTRGAVA